MYTAFYGLREKPFALVPDPRYLFLSEAHREALAHLLYGIEEGEGFIAVTGEVGTGKTTICRTLLERLGSETEVAFLFNPSRSGIELLQDICGEFSLETAGRSRSELGASLNRFLLEKKREHRRVLLIIDEAQNLTPSTLEQVRLLSNLETSSAKLIQILLLGQPELDRKLDSPQLRQLRQRISVRWALKPLAAKETRAYIRHRLHIAAGAERDIFSDSALRQVHRRTGGVPRLINVLCDRALLAGYVARTGRIGAAIVKRAASEIPDARRSPFARRLRPQRLAGARLLGVVALFTASLAVGIVLGSSELVRGARSLRSSFGLERAEAAGAVVADVASTPTGELAGGLESFAYSAVASAPPPSKVALASQATIEPALSFAAENGQFLAAVLETEDAGVLRQGALNSILRSFGLHGFGDAPDDDPRALMWLRERGLGVLAIQGADLDQLRPLNHPALLRVGPEGRQSLVALQGLDGDLVLLHGLSDAGPLRLPASELEGQWTGEAWVIWNDYEAIRPLLAFGERGQSVVWLQSALAELGYYDGNATGLFDQSTREGVRALQRQRGLLPDGLAGPRTRMALYNLLERYPVPRLVQVEDEAGEAG